MNVLKKHRCSLAVYLILIGTLILLFRRLHFGVGTSQNDSQNDPQKLRLTPSNDSPEQLAASGKHSSNQGVGPKLDSNRELPHPQIVFSTADKPALILFSARYDSHLRSVVIIGYFHEKALRNPPRISVRFNYAQPSSAKATVWKEVHGEAMHNDLSMPFNGVVYFCSCESHPVLVEVRATDSSKRASGNVTLSVQFANAKNFSTKAAVCIAPLRYLPNEEPEERLIMRIVEFIEVNRLLGVDHFYFYNLSLSTQSSRVLQHYVEIGWASVTQWALASDGNIEDDIHYYGQIYAMNDCLYAARDTHRLIAFIDIDEFMVPTNRKGVPISLEDAAKLHWMSDRGGNCALAFRNGLFPPSRAGAAASAAEREMPASMAGCKVANLLRNWRVKAIWPYPTRTKILVVARQIKHMAIHLIWKTWQGCRTYTLNPDTEGFLHHFRVWPPKEMVEDSSIKPLRRGIETAVSGARQRLKELLNIDICA